MPVKKKGKKLESLVKQVDSLTKNKLAVGHFKEQGNHKPSGIPLVTLMRRHHTGGTNFPGSRELLPRPVKSIFKHRAENTVKNSKLFSPHVRNWMKNPLDKNASSKLLTAMGDDLVKIEQSVFGDTSVLIPSKSRKGPLIDTGELKAKVAHKNTITNKIKEGG